MRNLLLLKGFRFYKISYLCKKLIINQEYTKILMKKTVTLFLLLFTVTYVFTACDDELNDDSNELGEYVTNQELEDLNCYIDLHLHLDGSMKVDMIKELAEVQDMELNYTDQELLDMLQVSDDCSDLNEYLEKFPFPLTFMQTKEGLQKSVELLCEELHELGVIYAEIRYAPQLHCDKGMTQREAIEAAIEGMKNSPIPVALILCCMRGDDNHEENIETVQLASEYLDEGVGAIDIAGAEALFPTEDFEDIFALAAQMGVPFTIHAGEADGPASVYKALEYGAKRIGHGVRSSESKQLMQALKEENIILECCPTSNLNTAIFTSREQFPYRIFMDNGVRFTINGDNMSVSNTDVKKEFQALNDVFNIKRTELLQILNNSVDAAFTTEEIKNDLREQIYSSVMKY